MLKLNCWKSLVSLVLIISGPSHAGSAKDALSIFEAATQSISQEKVRLITQKVNLLGRLSARQKKNALTAVNSGLLSQLADNMDKSVTNYGLYLAHLERFFKALDQGSPCYLPDTVDNERKGLERQRQIAEKIRAFEGVVKTEEEAAGVMVAVTTLATVNMLTTSQLAVLKLCVLAEMIPQGGSFVLEENESEVSGTKQSSVVIEQYQDVIELSVDDSLNINDWLPVLITDNQQISSLTFSHNVRVDKHFNLVIPKAALEKDFSFNISGQLMDQDLIYQLNVSVRRKVDRPLASLAISNTALKACIDKLASLYPHPTIEQLRVLQCRLNEREILSGEELAQLDYLQSLELSSVQSRDFARLSAIPSLTTVILNNSNVEAFPALRMAGATVLLNDVTMTDWSSLANLNSASVQVETDDCEALAKLSSLEKLLVLYQDVDNGDQLISLLSIDAEQRPTVITSNCNAP